MRAFSKSLAIKLFLTCNVLLACFTVYSQNNFAALNQVLTSKQKALGGNVCTLIYMNNQIIYESNLGKYNKITRERIASCSKWLTAALVMTFVDDGTLSLEDPVGKYLPEFNNNGKEGIRIKHCLSHTTGIESGPVTLRSIMAERKFTSLTEEVNSFASLPMAGEPGKVFAYSTIGLNTAGRVLEIISGKNFETLFQERIGKPLGMIQTSFSDGKATNPSGGAFSTPDDYLKFLIMMLKKGTYNEKRILSEKSVDLMETSQTSNAKILYTPNSREGTEYALGEWVMEKDKDDKSSVVSSPGLFGTFPVIDLKRNYAAIVFVKNLRIKNRKENYDAIKQAIDVSLNTNKYTNE
jgi:CubicO group peptidase (beta-lactamase class C family)